MGGGVTDQTRWTLDHALSHWHDFMVTENYYRIGYFIDLENFVKISKKEFYKKNVYFNVNNDLKRFILQNLNKNELTGIIVMKKIFFYKKILIFLFYSPTRMLLLKSKLVPYKS